MDETAATAPGVSVEMVILKCGCGHPETHRGQVCPSPQYREEIDGLVAVETKQGEF